MGGAREAVRAPRTNAPGQRVVSPVPSPGRKLHRDFASLSPSLMFMTGGIVVAYIRALLSDMYISAAHSWAAVTGYAGAMVGSCRRARRAMHGLRRHVVHPAVQSRGREVAPLVQSNLSQCIPNVPLGCSGGGSSSKTPSIRHGAPACLEEAPPASLAGLHSRRCANQTPQQT